MGCMAIGTTGDFFRKTEPVVLAMVTLHVGFDCDIENLVFCHQIFVAMALQADLGVEFPVCVAFRASERLNVMQIMAIVAGSGIHVSARNPFAMHGFLINRLFVMALNTFGNHLALVIFPVIMGMDIIMAIGASDPLAAMDTGVMLGTFALMAAFALNLLNLDFPFHMTGQVSDIHMATGAAILSVNRAGKCLDGHLVTVTAQAGGRINGHSLLG